MEGHATTQEEFWIILKAPNDTLSLVIKAHHSIEVKIQEAFSHVLPRSNKLEVERVGFLLKVDFLIGLGVLEPSVRHLYELVNTVRNRFAHNPYAEFTESDATKVKNAVHSVDKNYPCNGDAKAILILLFHVVFDYTTRCVEQRVIDALQSEAMNEMMKERPETPGLPPIPDAMLREVQAELDAELTKRVGEKLAARHPTIKLTPSSLTREG
jgi:hypothetical protein